MRITKGRLRRMIKEEKARLMEYGGRPYDPTVPGDWEHQEALMMAYPTQDATAELLINDYKKWVKEHGHITPASSSVIATYFVSRDRDDPVTQGWNHRVLADEFGIDQHDLTLELKRQRAEKGTSLGESKMRVSKRQLRRIIKEEKARLMREASPEPGSGTQEEWYRVERENLINFLIEDGVNIEMDNPFLTNEQLNAILRITRGQTKVGLG